MSSVTVIIITGNECHQDDLYVKSKSTVKYKTDREDSGGRTHVTVDLWILGAYGKRVEPPGKVIRTGGKREASQNRGVE